MVSKVYIQDISHPDSHSWLLGSELSANIQIGQEVTGNYFIA